MSSLSSFFSPGGQNTRSTTTSYLPAQATGMNNALGVYGPTLGAGQPSYSGDRVAGMTPEQQQALDVGGWAQYLTPGNIPMYGETGTALSGILSGETGAEQYTPEMIKSLMQTVYEQPAVKQWNEYLQPEIREAYSGPGFWSTARMQAETKGAQDLRDWLGSKYGQLSWDAEQANRATDEAKAGRALAAIQPALAYGGAPTEQATAAIQGRGALYGLSSAEQQQQQAEINANWDQWLEEQRKTDPESLNALMALLNMNYQTTTNKSETRGQGVGYDAANAFFTKIGSSLGSAASAGLSKGLGAMGGAGAGATTGVIG